MKIIKIAALIIMSCLTFSCSTLNSKREGSLLRQDVSNGKTTRNKDIKLYKNKKIEKWINYFSNKDRERFQRFLENGSYYKKLIQARLEEKGLPHLFYYLPLIESGFNTRAYSSAGAVGPWQFIKGTAKRYKLGVNSYIDERRDPILSTNAAIKYLQDLYNIFNSWELAIAAYNCGEMRVLRAVMRGNTRNFWELVDKKLLPRETREYVPKFLAAAYLGENKKRYKFKVKNKETYPDVESVDIPGGVSLKKLANVIGQDYDDLVHMNEGLKKRKTPNWKKNYRVWVASGFASKVKEVYPKLALSRSPRVKEHTYSHYRVRPGDNLSFISKKFKVSLARLKIMNKIRGSRIYIGQKLWLRSKQSREVVNKVFYTVKKNDTFGRIASKFRVRINYLQKLNGLFSSLIYVGQKLNISKGVTQFRYRVKPGDNLHKIALLYRTSINAIKRKNSLSSSRIYKDQFLII